MLTQQYLKSVLSYDKDSGEFSWIKGNSRTTFPGQKAGSLHPFGYVKIRMKVDDCERSYMAHRLAWLYIYGDWPKNQIDHINRNRSDNRICNLRDVECFQNKQNSTKQSNNTSGVKGVYWHKKTKKYQVNIMVKGLRIALGYFDDISEAALARKNAEDKHHPFYVR